ncbi:MAG: ribosomal protein S18-alanine N-acetyltransferase [Clostridia bacterium]|nr:ribosomal protein S18-alanine N-acetyltransferase [Clostridia bacterium]
MIKRVLVVGYTDTGVAPLCAAILNQMCTKKGIDDVVFDSCGFWGDRNQPVDSAMQRVAGELGIDLTRYKAKKVETKTVRAASLVIPQDEVIWRGIRELLQRKSFRLGKPAKLNQPMGGQLEDYRRARGEVLDYCRRFMRNLIDERRGDKKMMDGLTVVRLQTIHAEAVEQLEKECFTHPWSLASIVGELEKPTTEGCFIGAFWEDQLVGYGSLYKVGDEAYVNNIAVAKKMRRKGIGHLLLEGLIADCILSDVATLSLEVRSKNLDAIRLYETHGFTTIGCRKRFYRDPVDDGVIMTLFLTGEAPVAPPYEPTERELMMEQKQAKILSQLFLISYDEALERLVVRRRPYKIKRKRKNQPAE